MMNAPRGALDVSCASGLGLRNPTVVPLADPDWAAIHTVIEEGALWEIIERLRAAGASETMVSPMEKLVMARWRNGPTSHAMRNWVSRSSAWRH